MNICHFRYTPYGSFGRNAVHPLHTGFNGQRLDEVTDCYPLGNGYRNYSPGIRRFASPDSLSPFGKGGRNAYVYCEADPINNTDPSGHLIAPLLQAIAPYTRFSSTGAALAGARALWRAKNFYSMTWGALAVAAEFTSKLIPMNPFTKATVEVIGTISAFNAVASEQMAVPTPNQMVRPMVEHAVALADSLERGNQRFQRSGNEIRSGL